MNIKIDLSSGGISQLQKQLNEYAKKTLLQKTKLFLEKLSEIGISVGQETVYSSEYEDSQAIYFYKKIENNNNGFKAIVIGANKYNIIEKWQTKQGAEGMQIKQAEVSPILMAEFGSGWGANNPQEIVGYGQGTFPEQTHAFDVYGWSWMDLDGNWHHSSGVTASMPMYKAWVKMRTDIEKIAKEVFCNG